MGKKAPSLRRKRAAVAFIENHGNGSKALEAAGYSPATAKNPAQIIDTPSFQQLLDEMLPMNELMRVGREGLNATRIHGSMTEPDREVPDFAVRHKYYETGMKLHKKLGSEDKGNLIAVQVNVGDDRSKFG